MRYCKGKNQEAPLPPLKTNGSASVVDTTFTHPEYASTRISRGDASIVLDTDGSEAPSQDPVWTRRSPLASWKPSPNPNIRRHFVPVMPMPIAQRVNPISGHDTLTYANWMRLAHGQTYTAASAMILPFASNNLPMGAPTAGTSLAPSPSHPVFVTQVAELIATNNSSLLPPLQSAYVRSLHQQQQYRGDAEIGAVVTHNFSSHESVDERSFHSDIASELAYPSRRLHSPPPSAASPPNVRTTPVVATAFLSASKHEHVLKYLSGVHQPQQGSFEDQSAWPSLSPLPFNDRSNDFNTSGMDPNALGSGSNYEQLRNAFTSATLSSPLSDNPLNEYITFN